MQKRLNIMNSERKFQGKIIYQLPINVTSILIRRFENYTVEFVWFFLDKRIYSIP